jgi:hypothetical protein
MLEVPTRVTRTIDVHLAMVLAHLGVVVEVHVSQDVTAGPMLLAAATHDVGDQGDAPLLDQLVVDRLIEVTQHVHVSPPQLDADAVLETGGHGPAV